MVVQLSNTELKQIFNNLIAGELSREDADRWAYKMMQAFDNDSLEFIPSSDESKLWEGVQYLFGIDTMEEPGEYIHTIEEIEEEFNRKWNS
ncbi:hypothetical protein CWC22_020630 [Pseudoalteromonas rubra]|uniref:Uncharacterized protein n=1 Tax=Pseudoalteromonas rubra TaxID=43658 RepID=A0A5S3UZ50_9GAMM|nr:hypothetical protein [Pseudoalteromonas rubra]QPB85430.1 hypothetical protein CWC22_020630 [Pseudoalteromonas rubra]